MNSLHLHSLKPLIVKAQPNNSTSAKLQVSLPNEDIFAKTATLLKLFIDKQNPKLCSSIHAKILKSGLDSDQIISNSLLDMYAKCGQLEDAAKVFESMPDRTVVSWTSMISGYCRKGFPYNAIHLFSQMLEVMQPNEYTLAVILQACAVRSDMELLQAIHCCMVKYGFLVDTFLVNCLIDSYAVCGKLGFAEKVLEKSGNRDVVSWTSVISGCVSNRMMERALKNFTQMQEDSIMPNEVTVLSILQACSAINNRKLFLWIHGFIVKAGWCGYSFVVNSLVELYSINGYFVEGINVFCEFCFLGGGFYLSSKSMATLIQGCGSSRFLKLGEQIHGYLIKHGFIPSTIVENALIDMYGENKRDDLAYQIYTRMRVRDIISMNTLISCLTQNERSSEALHILKEIHSNCAQNKILPDFITMLVSVQACANMASLPIGQVIHGYIARAGMVQDIFIQNSLIDMYAKSGRLDFAEKIFLEMSEKDLSSWNSMIAAYGMNGNGISALRVFSDLKDSRIFQPNEITLTNVLSACVHAGLVNEGCEIFNSMEREYGIAPGMTHFTCMVNLLGRLGRLKDAQALIEMMPSTPGPDLWGALLGASSMFGNVEMAERAAKKLSILEPKGKAWRVALSNAYASASQWEEAAMVRTEIRGLEDMGKEGGWSSVEVRGNVFRFVTSDVKHPDSEVIYEVVNGIHDHIRDVAIVTSY